MIPTPEMIKLVARERQEQFIREAKTASALHELRRLASEVKHRPLVQLLRAQVPGVRSGA